MPINKYSHTQQYSHVRYAKKKKKSSRYKTK